MSIKKDIYVQMGDYLMGKLHTVDTDHPSGVLTPEMNMPNLQWFDKQMGQFTKPELSYAIPLPCVLMQFMPFNWETVGKLQQRGDGILRFTLYFENYADAFTGSVNSELALRFFEYCEILHQLLQGLTFENMKPLVRVGDNEDSEEDMIITSTIDYATTVNDIATDYTRNYEMADAEVTVERVNPTSRPARDKFTDGFMVPDQQ